MFGLRARAEGNGTGYETIAASGAHACVLHWIRNDGPLDRNNLLLLDAGVETDSLYTADITRTLPLSGRFSPSNGRSTNWCWRRRTRAWPRCGRARASGTSTGPGCG